MYTREELNKTKIYPVPPFDWSLQDRERGNYSAAPAGGLRVGIYTA